VLASRCPDSFCNRVFYAILDESVHECRLDFLHDTNGVLYWIATDGLKRAYTNPCSAGKVKVTLSSSPSVEESWLHTYLGCAPHTFVEHASDSRSLQYVGYACTNNRPNQWIAIDLGEGRSLLATQYTLCCSDSTGLRHWNLEGSDDGKRWELLCAHEHEYSVTADGAIIPLENVQRPYRHFRIILTGVNARRGHILACNCLELYGKLMIEPTTEN
jgi:hypothetical protein